MKLSERQRQLLARICKHGRTLVRADKRTVAGQLVKLGLAEGDGFVFMGWVHIHPTEKGKALNSIINERRKNGAISL